MRLTQIEKKEEVRKHNLNNGVYGTFYATEQELERWRNDIESFEKVGNCYSYEFETTHYTWTYHIEVSRQYLEQKLPLKHLLKIIQKLSNRGDRGALSKQLYKYYEKAGSSKLRPDFQKIFTAMEKNDPENRRHFIKDWVLSYNGKMKDFGHEHEEVIFDGVCSQHLSRCLAILIEKGYLETTKTTKRRGFRRSSHVYTYHNTYYKLTEKALKYLETK
jgi:hypothetical protein